MGYEKGHISKNSTMNYSCIKYHGKHSINLYLQKSENGETYGDEDNNKIFVVHVNDFQTDNSNSIVLTLL